VRLRRSLLGLVVAAFLAGAVVGYGSGQARPPTTGQVAAQTHTLGNRVCESNPLDGVHGPERLKVLKPCAVFQGTVGQAPHRNRDGDVSFSVSPDPGHASMLNATNVREGGLHIEIVPRDQPGCTPGQPVHVSDVPGLGICSGRDIASPELGAHVRIVGPWVLDRNNNWNEIHPAWSITAITSAGCRVPRVIGRRLRRARAVIGHSGCSVGKVSRHFSRKRFKGRVLAQRPLPGTMVPKGTRVNLTVGRRHHR
jgi:hypothetical protein